MTDKQCPVCGWKHVGTCDNPRNIRTEHVEFPKWYTRQQALEMALDHVRNYHDRCYLQFLISMEKRNEF